MWDVVDALFERQDRSIVCCSYSSLDAVGAMQGIKEGCAVAVLSAQMACVTQEWRTVSSWQQYILVASASIS